MLVPKSNEKWRTCIEFTNLNKTCPKDNFLLTRIDKLIDATAGHELLSFMDVYSGYNQILMYELDEEHTSFITNCWNLLLQSNVVWPKERRGYLPEASECYVQRLDREDDEGICG